MKIIHKEMAAGRWFTFSLFEQLANVGTDVDRAFRWKARGDQETSMQAFERALELIDLTITDPKNKGGRRREILRVREVLVDYFLYNNEYGTSYEFWYDYFYAFNHAAALQRGK